MPPAPDRDPAPGARSASGSGRRAQLLELVRSSPRPRTIQSLADELDIHPNTVRFHLDSLMRTGQVEQLDGTPEGPGRPPVLFRATRRMDPDGPTNYQLLARILAGHLAATDPDPPATGLALARAWGPTLTAAGRTGRPASRRDALLEVTRVLGELGFAPEQPRGARDTTLRLRHCPFLALVTGSAGSGTESSPLAAPGVTYADVICAMHLGLMQGAFDGLDGPITVDRLDRFAEPDLCVAHLTPVPDRRGDASSEGGHDG